MSQRKFKILTLDGGGIRGAFIAAFLATIEQTLKLDRPLADYFDLIAGTSTGGIIAIALALDHPATTIQTLYEREGQIIFERDLPARNPHWLARLLCWAVGRRLETPVDAAWLLAPKYRATGLKSALEQILGNKTIGDMRHRLIVPAVDLIKGQPVVFKTSHLPGLVRDRSMRAVEVALATAAAPTYFPIAQIGNGSAYVDGGLWANNPALISYAEAMHLKALKGVGPEFSGDEVHVLSVGTGKSTFFIKHSTVPAGLMFWFPRLLDVMGAAQAQGVDFAAKYLLGDRYYRVDFAISNGPWRLDDSSMIGELVHLGREKAVETVNEIRNVFFDTLATPFQPFST